MSKEHKLQSEMVIKFSQERPEDKGLLWSTRNITLSERDGQKQKALGMVRGVSDLILFKDDCLGGIEVKYPGERHKRIQIELQYNWGKKITENGGYYFIVTSVKGFWCLVNGNTNHPDIYDLKAIKERLDNSGKTIVF